MPEVLGTLVVKLGADTARFVDGMDQAQASLKTVQATAAKVAAVAGVAFAGMTAAMAKVTKAADVQARSLLMLENAARATGQAIDVKGIEAYAGELQELTGIGDEVTISAAAMLTQFGASEAALRELLPRVQDFSVRTGDMRTAADLVGKALAGQTSTLSRYGVVLSDAERELFKAASTAQRASLIAAKLDTQFKGLAATMRQTFIGATTAARNQFGDFLEALGEPLLPIATRGMNALVDGLRRATAWFKTLSVTTRRWLAAGALAVTALTGMAAALASIVAVLPFVIAGFKTLMGLGRLGAVVKGIGGIAVALGPIAAVAAGVAAQFFIWRKEITAVMRALADLEDFFLTVLESIGDAITRLLPEAFHRAFEEISRFIGTAIEDIKAEITEALGEDVLAALEFIGSSWAKQFEILGKISGASMADGIIDAVRGIDIGELLGPRFGRRAGAIGGVTPITGAGAVAGVGAGGAAVNAMRTALMEIADGLRRTGRRIRDAAATINADAKRAVALMRGAWQRAIAGLQAQAQAQGALFGALAGRLLGQMGEFVNVVGRGLRSAALAAEAGFGGALGFLLSVTADLVMKTEAFGRLVDSLGGIITALAVILEPIAFVVFEPIRLIANTIIVAAISILRLVETLSGVIDAVIGVVEDIQREALGAVGMQAQVLGMEEVGEILLDAAENVNLGFLDLTDTIEDLERLLDGGGGAFSIPEIQRQQQESRIALSGFAEIVSFLGKTFGDTTGIMTDFGDAVDGATASLLNVPTGFKVAMARFEAAEPEIIGGAGGVVAGAGVATVMQFGDVFLTAVDPEEFLRQLQEADRWASFRDTGTPLRSAASFALPNVKGSV